MKQLLNLSLSMKPLIHIGFLELMLYAFSDVPDNIFLRKSAWLREWLSNQIQNLWIGYNSPFIE